MTDEQHGKCVDIIVPRQKLIDTLSKIQSLEKQCEQQSTDFAFQLEHTRERQSNERQELCHKYEKNVDELRLELQALQAEYSDEKQLMHIAMEQKDTDHSTQMIQLETKLCEKILNESDKSADLKTKMDAMKEEYEKLLRKSADCLQESTGTLTKRFKQQLDERETQIKNLIDEIQTKKEEFFHYCKQLNIDNERRIAQLSLKHETRLKEANDMLTKWRTDASILTKNNDATTIHCDQLQKNLGSLSEENNRNKLCIAQLEQNIIELQREIDLRNKNVDNKEICLAQALEKCTAMETIKQHLNERAIELAAEIEPLNDRIKENLHEIGELRGAHAKMLVKIDDLNVEIKGQNDKRKIVSTALKLETSKVHYLETMLNRVCSDIYDVTQVIQQPLKLKEKTLELFKRYDIDLYYKFTADNFVKISMVDLFCRYVESSEKFEKIKAAPESPCKSQISKSAAARRKEWSHTNVDDKMPPPREHRCEQQRLIKENLFLLAEIDKLKAKKAPI